MTTISPSPGPVLKLAPRLAEADLVDVARTKSQAHLQAISGRPTLGVAVTDVLVRRGDRDVARTVAGNRGARISEHSFINLVKRAEDDGVLAEKVGTRPDIPAPMFRELLLKATAVVRERLLASAPSDVRIEINRILAKVSREVAATVGPRDYRAAQRVVLNLDRAGRLDETAVAAYCGEHKYEETVVALATLAKVPVNVVDRLMGGRPARSGADPVQSHRALAGRRCGRSSCCKATSGRRQGTAPTTLLPITTGFQNRRRSVSCGSGKCVRLRSYKRFKFSGRSKNTTRAARAPPWHDSASA